MKIEKQSNYSDELNLNHNMKYLMVKAVFSLKKFTKSFFLIFETPQTGQKKKRDLE